jgi:carboxymethylenebutenolidase
MHEQEGLNLNPTQQSMVALWEQHIAAEFQKHDVEATLPTMTLDPHVIHMPVMTGGAGLEGVREFYSKYFIPGLPPDNEIVLVSRTIGLNRLVDELVHRFTHTIEMPWMLPGVPPTGKRVAVPVVAIVEFQDGKIAREHIYWDQASVLVQLGVIQYDNLPVAGVETTRKLLDPSLPSNELIKRADRLQEGGL